MLSEATGGEIETAAQYAREWVSFQLGRSASLLFWWLVKLGEWAKQRHDRIYSWGETPRVARGTAADGGGQP